MKSIQFFTLRVFLAAMVTCAGIMLFMIWSGGQGYQTLMQLAVTLFIIGLADFLVWLVTVILEIRDRVGK